jgi:hypothetical protein
MQQLNEIETAEVAGAVTEGGCIPQMPGEITTSELLKVMSGEMTLEEALR